MIEKLKEKAKNDLKIDRTDLVNESLRTPNLFAQWLSIHASLKEKVRELQFLHDVAYKEQWLYYTGKAKAEVYKKEPFDLKVLKSDLGVFLQSDKTLQEHKKKIAEVQDAIQYVEFVIGEINKRSFHIKNALDAIKWESGA